MVNDSHRRSTLHRRFGSTHIHDLFFQKHLGFCSAPEDAHGGLEAARPAFEVGYESPSQFNREYKRFFGQPPMRDSKRFRHPISTLKPLGVPGSSAGACQLLQQSNALIHKLRPLAVQL